MSTLLVNVDVDDLDKAARFYCGAFDLRVGRRFEGAAVVDDLDSALSRAVNAGATLESEIQAHAWGRIALFADPFGNGFCLLQFTGRGYDEIAACRQSDVA